MLRVRVPLLGLFLVLSSASRGASDFFLKDGDTVVFYGDSITDRRLYSVFAETFAITRFPKLHLRFVHSGYSGDRVSGGFGGSIDLRLNRDVIAYKPTVVTILLGMNDGEYEPFDAERSRRFATGYEHIVGTLKSALPGFASHCSSPRPMTTLLAQLDSKVATTRSCGSTRVSFGRLHDAKT